MTTLFGSTATIALEAQTIPAPKKKRSLLPVLTVLFLISYGLMTMLIVEQGETIQAQRTLIRQLFTDSQELSALRMKAQKEKQMAQTHRQGAPAETPSTQAPSAQAPSTQVVPQHQAEKNGKAPKSHMQVPSRPAADLTDERRALKTI